MESNATNVTAKTLVHTIRFEDDGYELRVFDFRNASNNTVRVKVEVHDDGMSENDTPISKTFTDVATALAYANSLA